MGSKKDSIRLSTYDELFNTTPKPSASTLKKLRSVKHAGKGSELVAALRRQRVVVDERAIHFVAEARAGKRADARNSVFKLAQKYRVLPDSEHVQRIKQLYGKVKENEDSGDEEWDKASAKLPGKLELAAFLKLLHKDDAHEHLLDEMEEINQETADLPSDVEIQKAYESGVKLVKVNRMGYKFIRIVTIKDMLLAIHQPYTQSQVKVDRQVALHSIVSVHLGKESKEFDAIEELVKSNQEAAEFNPKGTVCCVVRLPKNRSLSLVFLDEDNRNGFVFFIRVLIKKARAALQQLEKQAAK
ncbi:hypothetical protein cyc_06009 [Cyclospora cayetanensis]|uniref:Uncharacterized protein n=1 Tax=Cyclospora cayetanensis TaxID=88456 RepID=A0A1D3CT52_9EIME|nr:hypothetical protein cyc_06009 [Cyclospora cayetanensis]